MLENDQHVVCDVQQSAAERGRVEQGDQPERPCQVAGVFQTAKNYRSSHEQSCIISALRYTTRQPCACIIRSASRIVLVGDCVRKEIRCRPLKEAEVRAGLAHGCHAINQHPVFFDGQLPARIYSTQSALLFTSARTTF